MAATEIALRISSSSDERKTSSAPSQTRVIAIPKASDKTHFRVRVNARSIDRRPERHSAKPGK
jgi:hypothetical protein